jgi:hypothetical protein
VSGVRLGVDRAHRSQSQWQAERQRRTASFSEQLQFGVNPLTGTIRIEVVTATDTQDGRNYLLRVLIGDPGHCDDGRASPPVTVNFSGTVEFTRGAHFDHYVLMFGDFEYARSTDNLDALRIARGLSTGIRHARFTTTESRAR